MEAVLEWLKWLIVQIPWIVPWLLLGAFVALTYWAFRNVAPAVVKALLESATATDKAGDALESVIAALESGENSNAQAHSSLADLILETRDATKRNLRLAETIEQLIRTRGG